MLINLNLVDIKMVWQPKHVIVTNDTKYVPFLRDAYDYAINNSDDPLTCVGTIVVNQRGDTLVYGVNRFLDGIAPLEARRDVEEKSNYIIHAELDAIFKAAKQGISLEESIMCMPWLPCTPCSHAVIGSGIKKLVGHKQMILQTSDYWYDKMDLSLDLLHEAGIEVLMYDGKIGGTKGLLVGEYWDP